MFTALIAMLFACSCARIATHRYASINPTMNSVGLAVSGYYLCPLSAEGPFPPWSNTVRMQLNPGITLPKSGRKEYVAGTDFSSRYDKVESGTMIVDISNLTVTVRFKYIPEYCRCRVQGTFPLKDYEVYPETFKDSSADK